MTINRTPNNCGIADAINRAGKRIATAGKFWNIPLFLVLSLTALGQPVPLRPPLQGIAHVAFFVRDLDASRAFYRDVLRLQQPYSIQRNGREWISFIKVNDRQYIELFVEEPRFAGRLNHIAFYTADVKQMQAYLRSRGVAIVDSVHKGRTGDTYFSVRDPDGRLIEIVEYQKDSWSKRTNGEFVSPDAVSEHISHVGLIVKAIPAAKAFYGDLLGFREFAQDTTSGARPKWIRMSTPGGTDYVELLLQPDDASRMQARDRNHLGLTCQDIRLAAAALHFRNPATGSLEAAQLHRASDQSESADLSSPDGTQIELVAPIKPIPQIPR